METNQLALRDDTFEPTSTGLVIHGEPTFDEWEFYGKKLTFVNGAIQWLIGDWLNYGEQKFNEIASQAWDETSWNYDTINRAKWVSSAIESCRRRINLSWSHHLEIAALEPEQQDKFLDEAQENDWTRQELRTAVRHHNQAKLIPPKLTGKYRIIYADPPWKYGDAMNIPGYKVSAEMHYPLMAIDELCALPVYSLAEDNSVLFLWVTVPLMQDAFRLIDVWGFEYKTHFVWDKVKHNFGHYSSVRHELLFVCTRGSCLPDIPQLYDSVVSIEKTDHSCKPEQFRNMIDTLYPNGARIELFARTKAAGWETWGNEPNTR